MLHMKKYFTEGLIQFTILLSLIGVRVDVDTYLNGYLSPLLETNVGPSSAYIQTPFHILRDTLDGNSLHPKCPDLDSYFLSRRLLNEVRALGSPRFPTQLSAWLVHLVPAESEPAEPNQTQNSSGADGDSSNHSDVEDDDSCLFYCRRHLENDSQPAAPETGTGPCPGELSKEDAEAVGAARRRVEDRPAAAEGGVSADTPMLTDSALGSEGLPGNGVVLLGDSLSSPEAQVFPTGDIDQRWQDFLSLPGLDDLDLDVVPRAADLGVDISSALSQDVSLQDAMVIGGGAGRGLEQRRMLRLESSNSSHSYPALDGADLAVQLFGGAENGTGNGTSRGGMSGFLDEAVFEQINLLGLGLEGVASLEERDSDSGLSLGSGSRSVASPGPSEVSCEDEGAVGYSSDTEPPACSMHLAEAVRHDHTYPAPPRSGAGCGRGAAPLREVKKEAVSEEEEEEEEELSRDEQRARALCIPVSVPEIVSMPVEDFLELLGGRGLTGAQVALLRDIRRRGKNKLAARNCRKRKLEVISELEEEVRRLGRQRDGLLRDHAHNAKALGVLTQRLDQLSRDVLSRLRDPQGRPLSPAQYSLHCGPDGQVSVLPRGRGPPQPRRDKRKKDKKH
ncbi:nuclear factor erythroid 2-related factor 3 [Megalops cyprinoides]|uniref:nuclear factor erythroid 2-related factor 3 n=1 Tax=Megalops cyprinoides TaxID=118141 RepID=UPI001864FE0E|nr:nuclear factor erythroid 2-related factor 3 [Megalops cyprinoides]